jgi:hypothetical protein
MEGRSSMSSNIKTVTFNKPKTATDNSVDRWVGDVGVSPERPAQPVRMKRFTLDVPEDLHRRIKSECANEGLKMADVLREMLETRFPAKP